MRRVKGSCIIRIKRDITFGNRLRLWNGDGCDVSRARFLFGVGCGVSCGFGMV